MATWTNITNAALEPDKPIRSIDGLALRDNPQAIAEGATGAPRIDSDAAVDWGGGGVGTTSAKDWVLARTSELSLGVVGSYAMLANQTVSLINPGDTEAGSNLRYSSAADDVSGSAPSGTWRCMGHALDSGSEASGESVTLFLRIA